MNAIGRFCVTLVLAGAAISQPALADQRADFIAGMTDPYALDEYARLFDAHVEFR